MYRPHTFPVSVKGVCVRDGRVLLLRNERDEWELPGGKIELGEDLIDCVCREVTEETGWVVTVGPILDVWQYHVSLDEDVLIVIYGCYVEGDLPMQISHEHNEAGLFTPEELPHLRLPNGYRRSIRDWFERLNTPAPH